MPSDITNDGQSRVVVSGGDTVSGNTVLRRYTELARRAGVELLAETMVTGWSAGGPLELTSPRGADQSRQVLSAASAGNDAERSLGQPEPRAGGGDDEVAGERDLEAAAERGAVDRGDDRLAERLQAPQQRLVLAHPAGELVGVLARELPLAGVERPALGAEHEEAAQPRPLVDGPREAAGGIRHLVGVRDRLVLARAPQAEAGEVVDRDLPPFSGLVVVGGARRGRVDEHRGKAHGASLDRR